MPECLYVSFLLFCVSHTPKSLDKWKGWFLLAEETSSFKSFDNVYVWAGPNGGFVALPLCRLCSWLPGWELGMADVMLRYASVNVTKVRVRLNRVKCKFRKRFPENGRVWLSRKTVFSGNAITVDQNFPLWPGNELLPSFSLQFISGSCKPQREGEKKLKTQHERGRENEQKNHTKNTTATQSDDPPNDPEEELRRTSEKPRSIQPPIDPIRRTIHRKNFFVQERQTPIDPANERNEGLRRTSEKLRSWKPPIAPIRRTSETKDLSERSATHRSARRPPRQTPQTHGEWQLKLSPPTHTSDPHTPSPPIQSPHRFSPSSRSDVWNIYIYIYMYIFI